MKRIRIEVPYDDEAEGGGKGFYSFPIECPRWLFWLIEKFEV